MSNYRRREGMPIPEAEVYARAVGKFFWACPNCAQEYTLGMFPWRRCDVACQRCKAKFQLGLGFHRTEPWRFSYLMGKWNSYTANRLNPIGTGLDGSAVVGLVEWQCPACAIPQKSVPSYDHQVSCGHCGTPWWVSLLFYRLPPVSRLKLKAPFDSIVLGLDYEAKPVKPSTATPAGKI